MPLQCSECQNKELKFQPLQFEVIKGQPRSAFGLTCTKCGHIEEIIKIKAPSKQSPSVDMRNYIKIVDYNALKSKFEALTRKLNSINIKAHEVNASGEIQLEPIDPNKPTGILDPKLQQKNLNAQTQAAQPSDRGATPEEGPESSGPEVDR